MSNLEAHEFDQISIYLLEVKQCVQEFVHIFILTVTISLTRLTKKKKNQIKNSKHVYLKLNNTHKLKNVYNSLFYL